MQKDSMALKSFHLLSILLLILTIVGAAFIPSVVAARPGVSNSAQPGELHNHLAYIYIVKNSKIFPKNVKFGLQTHINMENKLNGLDRLFGL